MTTHTWALAKLTQLCWTVPIRSMDAVSAESRARPSSAQIPRTPMTLVFHGNRKPAGRTPCPWLSRNQKCAAYRMLQTVTDPSEIPSVRQAPRAWRRPPGEKNPSVKHFPETKKSFPETHGNFPENPLCSNSFRLSPSRKFPRNFFWFPGKKCRVSLEKF